MSLWEGKLGFCVGVCMCFGHSKRFRTTNLFSIYPWLEFLKVHKFSIISNQFRVLGFFPSFFSSSFLKIFSQSNLG